MTQNKEMTARSEPAAQRAQQSQLPQQLAPFDPSPVFIHYDRGLQEYGDLFSDDDSSTAQMNSIEATETAETESHRP